LENNINLWIAQLRILDFLAAAFGPNYMYSARSWIKNQGDDVDRFVGVQE
jgi:hypothetical protein